MLRISAIVFFLPTILWANEPYTGYIFPAGGQRGTTVNFHVGGCFLHGQAHFEMLGAGVNASSIVREVPTTRLERLPVLEPTLNLLTDYYLDHQGEVAIAGDAPVGARFWRVWTSQGVSRNLKFEVGDLPEIVETEFDGVPMPVEVQSPLTINGRIHPRRDVDIWTFRAKVNQQYTCLVSARQLGSPLDARIEIRNPSGKVIAEATGSNLSDPQLTLSTQEEGEYQIHVHDVRFEGDQSFVYRLTLTDGPIIESVYPLGGQRGTDLAVQLTGNGLSESQQSVMLPGAAELQSFSHSFQMANRWTNAMRFEVGDLPELCEIDGNDEPVNALKFEIPATLNGCIERMGDVDYWTFAANADQKIDFDLQAARLGSPLDSVLVIQDSDGKELAINDDIDGSQSDSKLTFTASRDGLYRVVVRERFASRGGASFSYRLHARHSTADFRLFVNDAPGQEQFASRLNVVRASVGSSEAGEAKPTQTSMKVQVERFGGFSGEITLLVEGLPTGVVLEGNTIAEKASEATLKFAAASTAKIDVSKIRIFGTAKIGENEVRRQVQAGEVDHVLLAVAMATPFALRESYLQSLAPRGSTYYRTFGVERRGYDGPVHVRLSDRQQRHMQGVAGPTIELPAGQSQFEYPLQLHPTMWIGKTSRTIVMLSAEVTDHDGSRHQVSYSNHQPQGNQMIVVAEGELLTVLPEFPSVIVAPDKTIRIPVAVLRDETLGRVPVEIRILVPAHVNDVTCEAVMADAGDDRVELQVRLGAQPGPFTMPLTIQATAKTAEGQHVSISAIEFLRR